MTTDYGENYESNDTIIPVDYWDDHNCTPISERVPIEIAVPLYGYLYPVVVLITVVTNSFIVLVLSQPQLRSSTNRILLAMAVTESLTGLTGFPFFLYYYTFDGYKRDEAYGLPYFWCKTQQLFTEALPTVFHTSAIWLTVYLAVHRYFYVRQPQSATNNMQLGDSRKTIFFIVLVFVCSALLEMPRIFSRNLYHKQNPYKRDRLICCYSFAKWTLYLGPDNIFMLQYWLMALFVHAGPCVLLVVFGGLLIRTVSQAARRRRMSLVSIQSRCQGLHATTKMLIVVVSIFLVTEIPAAVIFIMHVCLVTMKANYDYHPLNVAVIIRNVFILISFPFNFAVYLSMSAQFRAVVKSILLRNGTFTNENETTNLLNLETRKMTAFDTTRGMSSVDCQDIPMVLSSSFNNHKSSVTVRE